METKETYMEDHTIVLPNIANGPTAIGDLWDCRTSTMVGLNLFGKKLDSQYLQVNETKELKYTLTHVRSVKDWHKLLKVSGEVALELLAGFIKADGEAEYESDEQSFTSEELLCNYDLKTFSVKALPSAKEVMDPVVTKKLLTGEIKATHVVIATNLGASATASIRQIETKSNDTDDNKGSLFGTLIAGPITAVTKASLEKLDASKSENFKLKIKVFSKSFLKSQPETISEMFQFFEEIGRRVEQEKHPAFVNPKDCIFSDVFGVPLQFYMVPIEHILEISVERLYVQIKGDILEKITSTLATLKDFQVHGYLKKRMFETEPDLKRILLDPKNPFVFKISVREKEIQALSKQVYSTCVETLKGYKLGEYGQQELFVLSNEADKTINIVSVLQEIQEYTFDGRMELLGMHEGDIENTHLLRIFTDTTDMMEWYQAKKSIKVLLRPGGNCANIGNVVCLYDMSRCLKAIGVEVGIATAGISEGHQNISIKIEDAEQTYFAEEISFIVKILLFLVNQVDQTSTRLFTIYASLNGIKFPFQKHLTDLHSMINILNDIKQVSIADSYMELRHLALKKDGRWKLVMDLNAVDSAVESINKFRFLNIQLSEVAGDWIVGNFGFESSNEYSNSPLVFVFRDENLQAVCFDNVDCLLLLEAFKPKGDDIFELLYPDKSTIEKGCLQKTRAEFAWKVVQLLQNKQNIMKDKLILSNSGPFLLTVNKNVEAVQILVRSFLAKDDLSLRHAVASIMMYDFPGDKIILECHTCIEEEHDYPAGFENINHQHLIATLKEFLNMHDPFYAKLQVVLESVSGFQTSAKKEPKIVDGSISNFARDTNCPKQLREQLLSCQENQDDSIRIEKIEKILQKYLETLKGSKFETVALFIRLLEIPPENLQNFLATELAPKLVSRLVVDDSKYPTFDAQLFQLVESCDYYRVLHVLAQMQYVENHLFLVHNQLEALTTTTDTSPLCQLLGNITVYKLSVDHYRWLFTSPKFVFLLERNSNCSQLLQTIKFFHCQKSKIPDFIPEFLSENLQKMIEEDIMVECPDTICNTDHAIAIFQMIVSQNRVPDNFGKVLGESVAKNCELKKNLKMAEALFYWSEECQLFTETWNCETVKDAYNQLLNLRHSLDEKKVDDEGKVPKFNIEIQSQPNVVQKSASDKENQDQQNELARGSRTKTWRSLLGSYSEIIVPRNFLEIQNILAEPRMAPVFQEGFMARLLPYFIQRLKMWGIHVVQQENLAKLNASQASMPKSKCFQKFVFDTNTSQSPTALGSSMKSNSKYPIARIDVLTCLNAVSHPLVLHDLLRVMSQFPVALPLVLQDVRENQWDFVCLVTLLKGISVKWEMQPGVVIHNQLFINPFKMIVALRVGSAKSGSSGKSTVLNQIMGSKHMFSSLGGPGADNGIPFTLYGSVEFAVLLPETCSYALWETVVKSHYSCGSNEVLMLVNVHGDALELPRTIELLKGMATSFIAFFLPCTRAELQTRSTKIQAMLGDNEDIVYILVDPTSECEGQPTNTINTTQLMMDNTLETVRSALGAAIQMGSSKVLMPLANICTRIRPSPNIFTEESELLLAYIKHLGCKNVRLVLQLQKTNPKYATNYAAFVISVWQKDVNLRNVIGNFIQILNLPINLRLLAFAHLDRELSLLSANESMQIREKLRKFQEQRRRLLNLEGGYTLYAEQKKIIEQIRITMDEQDGMSLGMEHLYRELGRIYQAAQSNNVPRNESILSLPGRFAELLIGGQAVEILDGDIGDMSGPWLNAICHSVCDVYPDLRVFTLSIIGLQSSGKSTLLNALFACKFAVSVGRCTRGLFMRLIFLDKSLTEELQIDAILLIDTEGLGAPEKLNDPEAEHKDRLLATFAMTVSNLTLINVLGESVRDLTDILQIVIVTMARLEKANISPDILMVQHLTERDTSKTMKGSDEFCKALEEAVLLTDSKDMAIGVRSCKSLRKLEYRVKNGQLLKQFRSFKNGASANAPPSQEYHEDVVELYNTILNACKQVTRPQKFHNWHELIQNYWAAVSTQDFSLRFKNIQEVHEFIDRGIAIAKVKEALDAAFRMHKECCETKLRQKVNELTNNAEGIRNWEIEKENELQTMREILKWIPHACEAPCAKCSEAMHLKNQLFKELEGKNCQPETEATINSYIQKTRESVIKHLSQMAEAIRVKHGWSCEFDAIIGSILMEKLKNEPNMSEIERKKMVDEVWSQVARQISQKLQVAPAKRRIHKEIKEEYDHATAVSKYFRRETSTKEFPELGRTKAIDFTVMGKMLNMVKDLVSFPRQNTHLDFNQVHFLESMLNNLPNYVMKKCLTNHFEDGMVRMLRNDIDKVLEEFETTHIQDGKLVPKFKWKVHIYALLKFTEVMTLKEDEWNGNNNLIISCNGMKTHTERRSTSA